MNLSLINELNADDAREAFLKCCGSERWAREMAEARPYAGDDELLRQAEQSFERLTRQDWLEAFAAHPKIGDLESLRKKYNSTKAWAQSEQSGVNGTTNEVLENLASGNQAYEQKFGYIFIVCATGKTAGEMLSILNERIPNSPENEFSIALAEQKKITQLRLGKL